MTSAKNSGWRKRPSPRAKTSLDDPRGIVFRGQASPGRAHRWPSSSPARAPSRRACSASWPSSFPKFARRSRNSTACSSRRGRRPVGPLVFPPPAFSETEREDARRRLMETDVAQPAVGAACLAMLRLLRGLGCEPSFLGGHSFGELVALHAAGVYDAARPGRAFE